MKVEIKKLNGTFNAKIRVSKRVKKRYKKRDLKNLSIAKKSSIINRPERLKEEKEKKLDELEKK